jgi:ABC-type sugar transport system substrate-binding protein
MKFIQAAKFTKNHRKCLITHALFVALLTVYALSATAQARKSPAPISAMRTITVVTEPKAIVWLDNIRYGATDENGRLEIKTVSKGQHTLRVRADGFKELVQQSRRRKKAKSKRF